MSQLAALEPMWNRDTAAITPQDGPAKSRQGGPARDSSGLQVPTGVLSVVGNTPTIELASLAASVSITLFAKLEYLNPGGSMKDRAALAILHRAFAEGRLARGGLVVESSSGNMGIGLAQACRCLGLRFLCVVDVKTTETHRRILESLGATVEMIVDPHPDTGDLLDARLERVAEIRAREPEAFWPDQYTNTASVEAHYETTAPELVAALGQPPDYMLVATSTCGTLGGFQRYFRDINARTKLIAVDAVGSALFGPPSPGRVIPGMGSSRQARFVNAADLTVSHVDTQDCVAGCHLVAEREAILVGGSSGGVVAAALRLARHVPDGTRVAVIFADRGERYLDTVYSPDWLAVHCPEFKSRMNELR